MLKHWNWLLPLVLVGLCYFAYNSPSFVGIRLRKTIGPLVAGIVGFFENMLGV